MMQKMVENFFQRRILQKGLLLGKGSLMSYVMFLVKIYTKLSYYSFKRNT
jgi:hypothetical protein